MPRNKTAKRTNKSQNTSNLLVSVQKMEKDFMQTPSRLVAQVSKEVINHKFHENKLKNALQKVKGSLKTSETRLKSAQGKNTITGKKQLKIAKKAHGEALKLQKELTKQLLVVTKSLDTLGGKHAKLTAVGKHLRQFDKDWSKAAKQAKVQPPVKAKAKTKAMPSTKKNRPKTREEFSAHEQPQYQSEDTTFEPITHDETPELAS